MPLLPEIHPEFGYLCPSPEVRRRLRAAITSMMFGILLGAGATLGLTAQHTLDQSPTALPASTGSAEVRASGTVADPARTNTAAPQHWQASHAGSLPPAAIKAAATPPSRMTATKAGGVRADGVTEPLPRLPAALSFSPAVSELDSPGIADPQSSSKRRERNVQAHRRKRHPDEDIGYSSYASSYRLPPRAREAAQREPGWGW